MDEHDQREQARRLVRLRRALLDAEMTGRGIGASRGRRPTDPERRAAFEAVDTLRALQGREGRTADEHDDEEEAAGLIRGKGRFKAAYYAVIGDPPILDADDRSGARAYHQRIGWALDMGGWTHSEQTALGALEKKWRARAHGHDVRFRFAGNTPGRVAADVQAQINAAKGRHP